MKNIFLLTIVLAVVFLLSGCSIEPDNRNLNQPIPVNDVEILTNNLNQSQPNLNQINTNNTPANINQTTEPKNLTDSYLIKYTQSAFDKEKMMFKSFILGYYNNVPITVSFPCSDVCPQYTMRIIKFDIALEKCEQIGGVIKEITVPFAIGVKQEKICLPKIIANL